MKVVRLLASAVLVMGLVSGCGSTSSSLASLASNPMITSVMGSMGGLSVDQAIGGVGSLLGMSKNKLGGDSWKKIADAVPGADALVDSGLQMTGLSDKVGSMADLSGGLSKLNLNQEQVDKMVPAMGDFMSKGGHAEAADLFKGAMK